jgi:ubiquinone/menaquinone biosynthesis C-methylase UbiE
MNDNRPEYWNTYWQQNDKKETFFNSLVSIARKYHFAKAFAKTIAKGYPLKGKTVCEIGVGTGQTLSWVQRMGAKSCTGVDFSPTAVELGRRLSPECTFVEGDAFALPFPDKSFDLVYSLGMIEHYDKETQMKLIREQMRVARECVFIEVPYDIWYFRLLFALNRRLGRTTTFSDEELFRPETFKNMGLTGKTVLMPNTFLLTIGHFEYLS